MLIVPYSNTAIVYKYRTCKAIMTWRLEAILWMFVVSHRYFKSNTPEYFKEKETFTFKSPSCGAHPPSESFLHAFKW